MIKWLRKAEQNPIAAQNFIQEVYELTNLLRTARAAVHLSTAHLQADMTWVDNYLMEQQPTMVL